ncbi:hypothetical protein WL16_32230 [Burkholderia ubonensis]|nr:hypothetical protein WL16_32230 [Burkholderia ubonensis]
MQHALALTPVAEAKERGRFWKLNVWIAVRCNRFEDHVDSSALVRAGPDGESDSSARTQHAIRLRKCFFGMREMMPTEIAAYCVEALVGERQGFRISDTKFKRGI